MPQRLLAFALAFVIVGGPLAGDVCEAFCAEHAGHSIDSTVPASHHHHSAEAVTEPSLHHHPDAAAAPSTRSVGFMPLPHGCGHLQAIVTDSRELTQASMLKAVVTIAQITPFLVRVSSVSEMDSRHGPPTPIRPTSPLRI